MRNSITLYEDQYKFFKTFNSPTLLIAFVEYMFEDIEPQGLTEQEQVIFDSLRIRMDNLKKKSEAGKKSHGGGRPPKTTEKQIENNETTNRKTSKKQQKNNTETTEKQQVKVKVKVKDKVQDKEQVQVNKQIILTNDSETKVSENGKKEINELIFLLKQEANNLGIAYDSTNERKFAKHILTAKEFGNFCEKIGQTRNEFAVNLMKASIHINYRKGICSGPQKIYQNYAEVYNKAVEMKNKQSKNLIQSF